MCYRDEYYEELERNREKEREVNINRVVERLKKEIKSDEDLYRVIAKLILRK